MASSMFSGIAAQLMATKGRLAAGDRSWMKRASTSLPVPDSPLISTVQSVEATRVASAYSARDAGVDDHRFAGEGLVFVLCLHGLLESKFRAGHTVPIQ